MGALTVAKDGVSRLIMWGNTHSSALLTATGEANLFLAVYSAVIATRETTRMLDDEEYEREELGYPEMTAWEKFKMVAPYYIPTIVFSLVSGGAFLLNTVQEERRIATLAGLYTVTEKNFEEYQEQTKALLGEKKEQKIRDEIDRKTLERNPLSGSSVVMTAGGNYLIYDKWSGRYFRSSIDNVRRALLDFREEILGDMYISLNELYQKLYLPPNDDGWELGWTIEDHLEFSYSCQLADNGEPALVITMVPPPHPDYNKLY